MYCNPKISPFVYNPCLPSQMISFTKIILTILQKNNSFLKK